MKLNVIGEYRSKLLTLFIGVSELFVTVSFSISFKDFNLSGFFHVFFALIYFVSNNGTDNNN